MKNSRNNTKKYVVHAVCKLWKCAAWMIISPWWYLKRHSITFCLPVHVWPSVKVTTCSYGHVKGTWADSHMPRGSAPSSTVMSLHPVTMWWVSLHTCTTLTSHFSHSRGSYCMDWGMEMKVSFTVAGYSSKGRSRFFFLVHLHTRGCTRRGTFLWKDETGQKVRKE